VSQTSSTSTPTQTSALLNETTNSTAGLSPSATIGLSVAGVLTAVGGMSAVAFFFKGGSLATGTAAVPAGDPLMSMAKSNPLYQGPGAVFENPLYETGAAGASGGEV